MSSGPKLDFHSVMLSDILFSLVHHDIHFHGSISSSHGPSFATGAAQYRNGAISHFLCAFCGLGAVDVLAMA